RRFGGSRRSAGATAQVAGRWSLTSTIFRRAAAPDQQRRTVAELLLERHGIVTRETVLAEGVPGGFSALYTAFADLETLGVCRRGYFIEGLGGAQFALPGAVERLRAQKDNDRTAQVLAATDPAQAYGAALKWPVRADAPQTTAPSRRPSRVAGAHVVLVGGEPVLYVERSGKGLQTLVDPGDDRVPGAIDALTEFVRGGRGRRLQIERVDGEDVIGSPFEALLVERGFRQGPRKLTLSA
ncbi:MAG: box helicase, partial [Solirubrobacterales bacterium]|nr:box helicase [Solirubrobacterales bacterium]